MHGCAHCVKEVQYVEAEIAQVSGIGWVFTERWTRCVDEEVGEVIDDVGFGSVLVAVVGRDDHCEGVREDTGVEKGEHEVDFREGVDEIEEHHYEVEAHCAPETVRFEGFDLAVVSHQLHYFKA